MDIMHTYAVGTAMILISIILGGSTGQFSARIYRTMLVGVSMILVNAVYWADWLVVSIVATVMVGFYLLFKNMTVG